MRRLFAPDTAVNPLDQALALMDEGLGLEFLLARLQPGSTMEDARRERRAQHQRTRRPSRLLDDELGIRRD